MQELLEAAEKVAADLKEELAAARREAAEAATKAADDHALELQRLELERSKAEVGTSVGWVAPLISCGCDSVGGQVEGCGPGAQTCMPEGSTCS